MGKRKDSVFTVATLVMAIFVSAGSMLVLPSFADAGTCDGYPPECRVREVAETGNTFCQCPGDEGTLEDELDGVQVQEPTEGDANLAQGIFSVVLNIISLLLYVTLFLSNFLLWLAGMLFNVVFVETVLKFGQNFGNSSGILAAWTVLRDLGNIFLLFSFVFMGIATILNLHDYTVKKTLPRLIIFAVLLNFSLFAAEAVVDVSNGISSAIVGQTVSASACAEAGGEFASTGETTISEGDSQLESCTRRYGITGLIMQNSQLSSILNTPSYQWGNYEQSLAQAATLFGLSIFSSLLSVVFFAAAIMLVIRVIVLTFIIVTAPIGFAGMAVPFMGGIAKRWWHELINQSFFIPVFLLLVFVGLKIVDGSGLNNIGGSTITDAIGSGNVAAFSVIVTFAVTAGFFLAALMIAKKFGAIGADFAIEKASNLTYGSLGAPWRQSVGRVAFHGARALRGTPLIGRALGGMLDKGATASFDMRGSGIAKAATGFAGINLGSAQGGAAHGFEGWTTEQKEHRIKHAEEVEENEQRRTKKRSAEYQYFLEKYNEAGGDDARARGDKRAQDLFNKLDKAFQTLNTTHEGKKYLLGKELEGNKREIARAERRRDVALAQAAALKARAAGTDAALRQPLLDQAALEASKANAAIAEIGQWKKSASKIEEEIEDLTDEIRKHELSVSRRLLTSAKWNRLNPFAAPEADLLASVELRRLEGRDPHTKDIEKILGSISKLGAKLGSGGGGGGHGSMASGEASAVEHSSEGEH